VKHVAVKAMDREWHAGQACSHAPEYARLRRVRVNDVGVESTDLRNQRAKRSSITPQVRGSAEARYLQGGDVGRTQLEVVPLRGSDAANEQA
jgi:hypothetical protein